jgi:hypothetical protein
MPQQGRKNMSGSTIILGILIPLAVIAGFAVWIGNIHFFHRRPRQKSTNPLKHTMQGGAFQATGGRQVAPRRDAVVPESLDYEQDDEK